MPPPEPPRRGAPLGRITEVNAAHGPHTPVPPATDNASTVPPPVDRRPPPRQYAVAHPVPRAPTLIASPAPPSEPPDDGDRPSTVQALQAAETLTGMVSERNARIVDLERQLTAKPAPHVETTELPTAHFVVAGNRWRLGVPLALLAPVLLWLWTQLQAYLDMGRQLKALNATVVSYEARMAADETRLADTKTEIGTLRETQAKLSGYLAGALPLAGVSVPGAEVGSIPVTIDRDADRVGLIRRTPVVTHTRVPAPPPLP